MARYRRVLCILLFASPAAWARSGRLDYVIFSDSVLAMPHSYVLNTRAMSPFELAATGLQVDDVLLHPANGVFDHLPLVTDFRMASIDQIGDLSGNGLLDEDDLRELQQQVVAESDQLRFDMNGDRLVDASDVDFWITEIFATFQGDANLDRTVDVSDLLAWNSSKFSTTDWFGGDFNSDGVADGSDFHIWNTNKFLSSNRVANVPEPDLTIFLSLGLTLVWAKFRGKSSREVDCTRLSTKRHTLGSPESRGHTAPDG